MNINADLNRNRYARSVGTIGEDGQQILSTKSVLVIGAGGLGGFVIEGLARMGVKTIGICDYDVFDVTNLNRQLFSSESKLGLSKVTTASERVKDIDSEIKTIIYNKPFPCDEITKDISNYDLIIDCLDSLKVRIILEDFCLENNKKIIHGAVGGYFGVVGVVTKDNKIIEKYALNGNDESNSAEKLMGNPYSIVGVVASLQVHLALLVLLGRPYLDKGMYYIDIQSFSIEEIAF